MATFTFDTAYIVAHLQNNANEALKQRIRSQLEWYRSLEFSRPRVGWLRLEQAVWSAEFSVALYDDDLTDDDFRSDQRAAIDGFFA